MKEYKIRAEMSGWATVACNDDDDYEDLDSGDYDYSAGNSGASYRKEVTVKIKAPDDMPTDSKEFRELIENAATEKVDSGNLDILDGENDLDDFEILGVQDVRSKKV